MTRKAYIKTPLEDGSIEVTEVILDKKKKPVKSAKKKVEVSDDKGNEEQEEKQVPSTRKETITIKRTES